jgi:tellurite resistance protein
MSQETTLSLEEEAERLRAELAVPREGELFHTAIEAGYLVARADGDVDATELDVLAKAVERLSAGAVIEWHTDGILAECKRLADDEGLERRAAAVGAALKQLGQAEAGLFVAALVARATKGVDRSEAELLKTIGRNAGLTTDEVLEIVKRAALSAP